MLSLRHSGSCVHCLLFMHTLTMSQAQKPHYVLPRVMLLNHHFSTASHDILTRATLACARVTCDRIFRALKMVGTGALVSILGNGGAWAKSGIVVVDIAILKRCWSGVRGLSTPQAVARPHTRDTRDPREGIPRSVKMNHACFTASHDILAHAIFASAWIIGDGTLPAL